MDVLCALLVFSFWSVAHTANPLRCYYCTNEDGKACFHPLNRSAIKTVNCGDLFYSEDKRQSGVRMESLEVIENYQKVGAGADFECFALVKNFSAGNAEVVRSCKIVEKVNYCTYVKSQSFGYNVTECFTCQTDGCNSAPKLGNTAVATFVALMAAMLLKTIA